MLRKFKLKIAVQLFAAKATGRQLGLSRLQFTNKFRLNTQ